ncbi:hypothetical protein GSI_08839 [Ganoderma sinense ZZ0214-1]|uniref:Integrase catalytic domain-containing protein n=1 Tax=Ganoderma sinense ZZ0214-1 TaxID=1077348 RepID=A0A2G8S4X4_9APHY|nr:hypothetical protein GSI_08839 [Ganoderma sinense ZZ0214-1]
MHVFPLFSTCPYPILPSVTDADRVSSRTSPTLVTYTRTRSLDTPSLALTFPRAVLRVHAPLAVTHIKAASFDIPDQIAAGLFLSTLVDHEGEPSQWQAYTAKVTLTATTTLNEILADARNERHRVLGNKPPGMASTDSALNAMDIALATLEQEARGKGKKWCCHCRRKGHWFSECRSKDDAPGKKQRTRGRKKGEKREKSHVAQDDDDDTSGSADENSHFVRSETVLYTSLSQYTAREASSPRTMPVTDFAFVMRSPPTSDFESTSGSRTHKPKTIVIDSGTSSHVHSRKSDFISVKPTSSSIRGFGDGKTTVAGRGEAQVLASLPDYGCTRLRLMDTCYTPNTSPSLISVSRLDDANCYTLFGNGRCVTFEKQDSGALLRNALTSEKVVLTGTKGPDRLYHLDVPPADTAYTTSEAAPTRLQSWHRRMGHLNYKSLWRMIQKGRLRGVKLSTAELNAEPPPCPSCIMGKMTRASFPPSEGIKAERALEFVSTDLWGKGQVQTPSGKRYLMTLTDHFTRWLWVAYLRRKSDAFAAFKEWLLMVERETGHKLAALRADNGGEYVSDAFKTFCKQRGIRLETTSTRTPEQNGIGERQNRSVFDRVRTVLIDAGLPPRYWGEAVNHIVYTKNCNPTTALKGRSPYEVRYNRAPDASFLHRFGCRAFVYDDRPGRKKLDPRGREGVFLGYASTQKAYRVLLPNGKVVTSIHVKFNDDVNGYTGPLPEGESYDSLFELEADLPAPPDEDRSSSSQIPGTSIDPVVPPAPAPLPLPEPADLPPAPRPRGRPKGSKTKKGGTATRHSDRIAARQDNAPPQAVEAPAAAPPDPGPGGVPEPDPGFESELTELSDDPDVSLLLEHSFILYGDEPRTVEEALDSPDADEWLAAMHKELESIAALETFELTELPRGRKPIGTKWVFLKKRDTDGRVVRFKARLVAQGFSQIPGTDFNNTYAPVAKPESIRAICALTAQRGGVIHVVDVDSAFLNSEIPDGEEAYVKQPPGFVQQGQESLVWRLSKALYGLKQSGYLWYQKLRSIMLKLGFKTCRSDTCVFYRYDSNELTIVTSHVDDLALFCPSNLVVTRLKAEIAPSLSVGAPMQKHSTL